MREGERQREREGGSSNSNILLTRPFQPVTFTGWANKISLIQSSIHLHPSHPYGIHGRGYQSHFTYVMFAYLPFNLKTFVHKACQLSCFICMIVLGQDIVHCGVLDALDTNLYIWDKRKKTELHHLCNLCRKDIYSWSLSSRVQNDFCTYLYRSLRDGSTLVLVYPWRLLLSHNHNVTLHESWIMRLV